ncbi:uncharacterized protein LOC117642030 [Thrips palmi]|uniref:Uncharacterized protein LOC117642030 n=1 Tax=Thrips palmi TaxID=161013 RepID=A0A6P8Y7U9_THRPL|nr:uncharacterized protein LOC117642030 [Thrips palmi]
MSVSRHRWEQKSLGSALSGCPARHSGSLSHLQPPAPQGQGSQARPQGPHSSSTHSLGAAGTSSTSQVQGPGRPARDILGSHHAYFGLKQPHRHSGVHSVGLLGSQTVSQTVGNVGFITASGLSELRLRPGYRWQR